MLSFFLALFVLSHSAGGLTFFAPSEDRVDSGLYSRQFLEGQLAVALGGRLAEEIVFGAEEITTGASNDLQRVTQVARQMVTRLGMSDAVGQLVVDTGGGGNPFLGRQMASPSAMVSSATKATVDDEVNRLVAVAYKRAKACIIANRVLLDKLAAALIENEVVSSDDFQRMIAETDITMMPYSMYETAAI
jgi:cell division protease FtsH